ncbi:MAG TPA: phosphatidate cytidylyltransferase [Thermoanaerobaculia bacterium]|nr:phosphatidate cytidylyltransferase [Thermoanaerobaculia bacterium]
MRRLLTALALLAVIAPVVFLLPSAGVLVAALLVLTLAAIELARLLRRIQPGPFGVLPFLVPLGAAAPLLLDAGGIPPSTPVLGAALVLAAFVPVVAARTPAEHAAPAAGLLALALPYLAVPAYSIYRLHRFDPWVLVLAVAIVAAQDTAAFYVGKAFGRRRMAPRLSPKKTWEGAAAGFAAAIVLVAVWCVARLGEVDWRWLVVGAASAVAAQFGDLCESLIKRSAGAKDSGTTLPGHGGVLDRIDALLLAAPTLLVGLVLLGLEPGT